MQLAWKLLKSSPLSARIGMCIVLLNVVCAIGAQWLAPYGETTIIGAPWEPPIWSSNAVAHDPVSLLGTDQLGRDLFSRLLFGAQNTIALAGTITLLAFLVGTTFGFLSATLKGWVDMVLGRIVDILMAFPTLIFALVIMSVMGTSTLVLVLVTSLLSATKVYRLARAIGMDIVAMEYVEVARLRGEGHFWVMRQEILPNAMAPLAAEMGLRFCFAFLFISALSFLGLGIQPPNADWGSMVRENAAAISFGFIAPLIPAAAVAFLTVGVNLVVDWFLHKASGIKDVG